jgi:hypothetical protein
MLRRKDLQAGVRVIVTSFCRELVKHVESRNWKGRVWGRPWITRRELHVASVTVLKELTIEDPLPCTYHLRMSRLLKNLKSY